MKMEQHKEFLKNLNNDELMMLKANVEVELAERGVSFNVGAIGERLAISFFNSTPGLPNLIQAPAGAKNVDALSRQGDRYSIKAFSKAKKTGTVYPDHNDPMKQLFEYLLVVHLDNYYQLSAIYRYTWDKFVNIRAWDKRMNAWYLPLSQRNLELVELIFRK
jgi:hypothetical protein